MTDDMEQLLRAALREKASVPATNGDPVPLVESRMKRRTKRRGILVASTAAMCVAVIAVTANALAGDDSASRPAGPAVGSSTPAPINPSKRPQTTSPLKSAEASAPAPSPTAVSTPPLNAETLPPNVSSFTFTSGYDFDAVTTESGLLLVTGTVPVPSTTLKPDCAAMSINGGTGAMDALSINTCNDPASTGRQVAMVDTETTDPKSTSGVGGTIAIARHESKTNSYTMSPVVMRYDAASDTRPVSAYGGGSLWIYDVDTANGPEALQVSATSGQVQDVVRTPLLYRPMMAANSDGLWLGNSIEGSDVAGTLFHVAPGSHTVTAVVSSTTDAVDWLVADNGHVWAGIRPSNGAGGLSLWRFDGPQATVVFHTPEPSLQVGPNFVVGNAQDGLWLTTPDPPIGNRPSPTDNRHFDVVRLDPNTGKPTVEAQLPPLDLNAAESQTAAGQAAIFAGNYFLLQSPSVGGYTGFMQLLRVTPLP